MTMVKQIKTLFVKKYFCYSFRSFVGFWPVKTLPDVFLAGEDPTGRVFGR
jgi:hypothetical protein